MFVLYVSLIRLGIDKRPVCAFRLFIKTAAYYRRDTYGINYKVTLKNQKTKSCRPLSVFRQASVLWIPAEACSKGRMNIKTRILSEIPEIFTKFAQSQTQCHVGGFQAKGIRRGGQGEKLHPCRGKAAHITACRKPEHSRP